MKHSGLKYEELIENTSFQEWVLSGRAIHNEYWQTQLNDDSRPTIEAAAAFVAQFQFKKESLPNTVIEAEWEKLHTRISSPNISSPNISKTTVTTRRIWLQGVAAAVTLLLIGTSAFFLFSKKQKLIVQEVGFGEQLDYTFSDASSITVNSNSSIKFNKKWKKNEARKVELTGQAFFKVQKTATKAAFQVVTNAFTVEVLGTEFDVMAREGKASVTLKEGSIKVLFNETQKVLADGKVQTLQAITLSPDECLKLVDGQFYKTKVNTANQMAWLKQKLVLDNTSLAELAGMIKDLYGYDITFDSAEMKNERITGNVSIENFDVLLSSIQAIWNVKIEQVSEKRLKFVKQ